LSVPDGLYWTGDCSGVCQILIELELVLVLNCSHRFLPASFLESASKSSGCISARRVPKPALGQEDRFDGSGPDQSIGLHARPSIYRVRPAFPFLVVKGACESTASSIRLRL
jgi:hypothetical protein